jgi:20S proteasome subunit beta 3
VRPRRYQRLKFRHNLYKLREERNIKPSTFGEMVSSMLYEKRSRSHS